MDLQPDRVVARALDLLRAQDYAHVATIGDGDVHTRQVQLLEVTDDLVARFLTSPRSRKVDELRATGRATLAVDDAGTFTAVSAVGAAVVVDDPDVVESHWIEELRRFFPDGPRGGDCVLVEITIERVEVIDFAGGITPAPFGLVPAVAVRRAGEWELIAADRSA